MSGLLRPVGPEPVQTYLAHAYIVTPKTTDRLCAPYLTRGEVSCQNGNRVVLNAKRWLLGADSYGSDLTNCRRYLVNHESDMPWASTTWTARVPESWRR